MLKNRKKAAQQLANRLFETEGAIDEAISKMAELTGYMPVARSNANLSVVVGQDAIAQAAQTLAALVEARGQIVETHHKLAKARDQIGLREMAVGGGNSKPLVQAEEDRDSVVTLVDRAA
ncbi:MAG: hypothetical protein ABJN65_01845 [Parasphingorhabdus sp.]